METFFTLLNLCEWNSPDTGRFPSDRPETRIFDAFFDKQTVEQTIETPVIWDAMASIMMSL